MPTKEIRRKLNEIKRGPGRPRKEKPVKFENDLPVPVQNCLHGRSAELIKIIQELKGKMAPLEKELDAAVEELQCIQEFMSEHDKPVQEVEE